VIIPAALPNIVSGLRISMGIAWLVIVAAEMLLGTGLGYFIWNEWNNLYIPNILVAIFIIGIVGLILDSIFAALKDLLHLVETRECSTCELSYSGGNPFANGTAVHS
jgi:nitrate/nitrite transport system permease protein